VRDFTKKAFPVLLDLLYDAALHPEKWPTFLDALPSSFDGASGIFHVVDVPTSTIRTFHSFGTDPEFIASYAKHFASVNPYAPLGFERLPLGKVLDATAFLDREIVERTEFFHDWMKPQGITCDHLAVSCLNDGESVATLSIAPHASVYREQRKASQQGLSLLAPHVMRAIEINRAMARARQAERVAGGSLDALRLAAFLVDKSRTLLLANSKGEELLRQDRVLSVDRFKRLSALHPNEQSTFAAAVGQALRPPTADTTRPVRLTSRMSGQIYVAWPLPMSSNFQEELSNRARLVVDFNAEATVLVLVVAAARGLSIPPDAIQVAFRLSTAEARLASALVAGQTLAEFAHDNALSRNTVRNQLASALEKTEVHRQTEFVTLIVGTLGTLAGVEIAEP
jgi:DNA-binding CsgD family transcriptional regulator